MPSATVALQEQQSLVQNIATLQPAEWFYFASNPSPPKAAKVYSHVDCLQNMAADAAMDTTCPSPELGDSRKRPLDDGTDDGTSKRSHFSTNGKSSQALHRVSTLYPPLKILPKNPITSRLGPPAIHNFRFLPISSLSAIHNHHILSQNKQPFPKIKPGARINQSTFSTRF